MLTCTSSVRSIGSRFAASSKYQPFESTWQEQKEILIDRIGFWGYVVVQATCHGTDNAVVVDALEHMEGRAAGVVSVTEDVTTEELRRMHEAGVRGVRFAFLPHIASETTPAEVIQRIAKKIEPFGWHTDLYFLPETFEVMEPLIKSLPTPVIIDHMGRPDVKIPVESNEYFKRLIDLGASRERRLLEADVARSLHALRAARRLARRSAVRAHVDAAFSREMSSAERIGPVRT